MSLPLMPKATAVWLIEKTALTFDQIADFCGMHPLEVQAIADGEVAQGIVGKVLANDDARRAVERILERAKSDVRALLDVNRDLVEALRESGLLDPVALRLTSLDPNAAIDTSAVREHRAYAEARLREMAEFLGHRDSADAATLATLSPRWRDHVRELEKRGWVTRLRTAEPPAAPQTDVRAAPGPEPTPEQLSAIDAIAAARLRSRWRRVRSAVVIGGALASAS